MAGVAGNTFDCNVEFIFNGIKTIAAVRITDTTLGDAEAQVYLTVCGCYTTTPNSLSYGTPAQYVNCISVPVPAGATVTVIRTERLGPHQYDTVIAGAASDDERIREIEEKIPIEASLVNKLADKQWVNDAVLLEQTRAQQAEQAIVNMIPSDVSGLIGRIAAEETRARQAETSLNTSIGNEKTRAQGAEQANATAISNEVSARIAAVSTEKTRAETAEGALTTAINTEKTRAETAEAGIVTSVTANLGARIDEILDIVPVQASTTNQLADKAFVNSSITSMVARYITPTAAGNVGFASLAALNTGPWFYQGTAATPSNNDYAIYISATNQQCRAAFDGVQWNLQYIVNDTPFTAAQLAAINSSITSALVTQIGTNQTAISNEITNRGTAVNAEKSRAMGEEETLADAIADEATRATGAESTIAEYVNDLGAQLDSMADHIGDVDAAITDNATAVATEKTRATGVESTLSTAISNETTARTTADTTLTNNKQDKITGVASSTALLVQPTTTGGQPQTRALNTLLLSPAAQTANTQILMAPATQGAAPTLLAKTDLMLSPAAQTANTQILMAPATKGAAPTLKEFSSIGCRQLTSAEIALMLRGWQSNPDADKQAFFTAMAPGTFAYGSPTAAQADAATPALLNWTGSRYCKIVVGRNSSADGYMEISPSYFPIDGTAILRRLLVSYNQPMQTSATYQGYVAEVLRYANTIKPFTITPRSGVYTNDIQQALGQGYVALDAIPIVLTTARAASGSALELAAITLPTNISIRGVPVCPVWGWSASRYAQVGMASLYSNIIRISTTVDTAANFQIAFQMIVPLNY